jgi:cytochrome c oxidase cbb3-type subunit 3
MTTPRRKTESPDTTGHVWDEDLREYNNPLPRWWLNLFYLTLIFGLAYLILFPGLGSFGGVLSWTSQKKYQQELAQADVQYGPLYEKYRRQDIRVLASDAEALKTGERLFINYCSACHGSDARGAPGFPNLRDNDWLWGGDPEVIEKTILDGRSGAMPAWGETLGRHNIFNVAEYVRSLSGANQVDEAVAAAGEKTFKTTCVVCHGKDARGNVAFGAPNLTDDVWLYGGNQDTVIASITNGRGGRMPANREFLGEAKVHLLAAYVYSLSHSPDAKRH